MTTQSTSDMPGTEGLNASDYKVYLAEASVDFDFGAKLKEAQEALEAAQLAYIEATEACRDREAAQAAADKALEAAERAIAIKEEASNAPSSPENREKQNEILRIGNNARVVANYAQNVVDSGWDGKSFCSEGIPMSQADPRLPADAFVSAATASSDTAWFKQDSPPSDMRDSSHPDHSRFETVYAGVTNFSQERGYTPDQSSERLAAALTVQTKVDGLETVRHVAMSSDGTRAFAIDSQDPASPSANRASVDVALATQQSVSASNEKLERLNTGLSIQRQDPAAIALEAPTLGPRMA